MNQRSIQCFESASWSQTRNANPESGSCYSPRYSTRSTLCHHTGNKNYTFLLSLFYKLSFWFPFKALYKFLNICRCKKTFLKSCISELRVNCPSILPRGPEFWSGSVLPIQIRILEGTPMLIHGTPLKKLKTSVVLLPLEHSIYPWTKYI